MVPSLVPGLLPVQNEEEVLEFRQTELLPNNFSWIVLLNKFHPRRRNVSQFISIYSISRNFINLKQGPKKYKNNVRVCESTYCTACTGTGTYTFLFSGIRDKKFSLKSSVAEPEPALLCLLYSRLFDSSFGSSSDPKIVGKVPQKFYLLMGYVVYMAR